MTSQRYGDLIRLDTTDGDAAPPEILRRVRLGAGVSEGGIDEAGLQELLFRYPEALPIAAIDAAYAGAVPICTELSLPAGYADALYINHLGRITLAEFKLWRHPEARREVIGQILDYAKDLASWGYEDLQRQVSLARGGRAGNVPYDLVKAQHPQIAEAEFGDNVIRHLKRGEFLLLIVGDGIRESAENIVRFVQQHSGLHFNLALVEAALYRDAVDSLIVQPRVLARTEIVQRFVVDGGIVQDVAMANEVDRQEALSDQEAEHLRFWTAVLSDFSFSDPDVSVPAPTKDLTQYVLVVGAGRGGNALTFSPYLNRRAGEMGCYLIAWHNFPREERIFNELAAAKDTLLPSMEQWPLSGGLKIGFRRGGSLDFLAGDEDSEAYREAVAWMREHLNRLVSTLHPDIRTKLSNPS